MVEVVCCYDSLWAQVFNADQCPIDYRHQFFSHGGAATLLHTAREDEEVNISGAQCSPGAEVYSLGLSSCSQASIQTARVNYNTRVNRGLANLPLLRTHQFVLTCPPMQLRTGPLCCDSSRSWYETERLYRSMRSPLLHFAKKKTCGSS